MDERPDRCRERHESGYTGRRQAKNDITAMKKRKKLQKPLTEKKRAELIERWENTPSENPEYKGKTPTDLAKMLLKPVKKKGKK